VNASTKQLKNAVSAIKLIINYCDRVLRQESYHSLESITMPYVDDIKTQNFLKISLLELIKFVDISDLTRECLHLIEKRIDTERRIKRCQLLLDQIMDRCRGSSQIERLKRTFQKGLSSSFKERSTTTQPKPMAGIEKIRILEKFGSNHRLDMKARNPIQIVPYLIIKRNVSVQMTQSRSIFHLETHQILLVTWRIRIIIRRA
jgi:chorismate mutase